MKSLIFLVLLVVYCGLGAVSAKGCFHVDVTKLDRSTYFRDHVAKGGHRHKIFHDKIRKTKHGKKARVDKILTFTQDGAQSDFFTDQWESMFRTLWISSISAGDLNTDNLCLMANILNSSVLIENGQLGLSDLECILDLNVYLIVDAFYRLISITLEENHCPVVDIPTIELPTCYKISKCIDGGKYYDFENVWKEYEANQKELEVKGEDNNNAPILYPTIKEFYHSDDLYENYIAAIFSLNAANRDWLWKAGVMNGPIIHLKLIYMSVFEQTMTTLDDCPCSSLHQALVRSVNDHHNSLNLLRQALLLGSQAIFAGGHLLKEIGKGIVRVPNVLDALGSDSHHHRKQ